MKATDKQLAYLAKLLAPIAELGNVSFDLSPLSKVEASILIRDLLTPATSIYECQLRDNDHAELYAKIAKD